MKIHNQNNLPLIDYRKVTPLQGNLKDLTEKNYAKLKRVLEKRGFEIPLFIWRKQVGDKTFNYLLDGHQRQRVMLKEDMNDNGSYEVPYILIEAKNKNEAKAKLLEITSQYGTMTYAGFDEFVAEIPEFDPEDLAFDALPLLSEEHSDDYSEEDNGEVNAENGIVMIRIATPDYMQIRETIEDLLKPYQHHIRQS